MQCIQCPCLDPVYRVYVGLHKLTFGSARALITFPRARRERLMLAPSRMRAPLVLAVLALSEPARSIRLILATQAFGLRLAVLSCCRKYIWKKNNSQLKTIKRPKLWRTVRQRSHSFSSIKFKTFSRVIHGHSPQFKDPMRHSLRQRLITG